MHSSTNGSQQGVPALLNAFSLEITGKDLRELQTAAGRFPAGTRVNVTYLGNEDATTRVAACKVIRDLGLRAVPHVSARRVGSRGELDSYLSELAGVGASEEIVVIGGDPFEPEGPYADSLSVIRSGLLDEHGVRKVDIAGYPEGHPRIADDVLWQALQDKATALAEQGLEYAVATQFVFDSTAVVNWVERLRDRGVDAPVRIGVPGPAGVQRLLRYARRFGVQSSASIVQKYGFSLSGLLGTAGPTRFVEDLATAINPSRHGKVFLHFYTFGGVRATAEWVENARSK